MKGTKSLREYLAKPFSKQRFSLSTNDNMSFHWADFALTCDINKELIQRDQNVSSMHNIMVGQLERLKTVPVWVRTIDGVSTLSLFDIYDSLATKGKMSRFYVNQSGKLVISFHGPEGPFEVLSPAECVHPDRYSEMIFDYIFKGKLPTRDFRLRCEGKILCYFDVCFNKSTQIDVEQITTEGILFSTKDNELKDKITNSKEIKVLMNLEVFHKALSYNFDGMRNLFSDYKNSLFFTRDSRHAYHIQPKHMYFYQAYDHDVTGQTYFFVPFAFIKGQRRYCTELIERVYQ
jgi:hypothetical protein